TILRPAFGGTIDQRCTTVPEQPATGSQIVPVFPQFKVRPRGLGSHRGTRHGGTVTMASQGAPSDTATPLQVAPSTTWKVRFEVPRFAVEPTATVTHSLLDEPTIPSPAFGGTIDQRCTTVPEQPATGSQIVPVCPQFKVRSRGLGSHRGT